MSKIVKLNAVSIGGDIDVVDIYHTSITGSNLISSSVTPAQLTGSGLLFEVADDVTTFWAYAPTGSCFGASGSVTASVYSPNTRYFTFFASGSNEEGTIEMSSPTTINATTSSFTASVNFNDFASATVVATSHTYPDDQFQGWYYSSTSSAAFATGSTLTLTLNTFTGSDDIYAFFADL
tara:strand:+ start:360 stop:896 length:537 start_codon:yes stop_codon:yes gene_type:complete